MKSIEDYINEKNDYIQLINIVPNKDFSTCVYFKIGDYFYKFILIDDAAIKNNDKLIKHQQHGKFLNIIKSQASEVYKQKEGTSTWEKIK